MSEVNNISVGSSHYLDSKDNTQNLTEQHNAIKDALLGKAEHNKLSKTDEGSQGSAPAESTMHKVGRWALKILGGLLIAAGVATMIAGSAISFGAAALGAAAFAATSAAGLGLICKSIEMAPETNAIDVKKEASQFNKNIDAMNDFLEGIKISKPKKQVSNEPSMTLLQTIFMDKTLSKEQKATIEKLKEEIEQNIVHKPLSEFLTRKITLTQKNWTDAEGELYLLEHECWDKLTKEELNMINSHKLKNLDELIQLYKNKAD